jgi:hypothetical protein
LLLVVICCFSWELHVIRRVIIRIFYCFASSEGVQEYSVDLNRIYDKGFPRRDKVTRQEDLLRAFFLRSSGWGCNNPCIFKQRTKINWWSWLFLRIACY